MFSGKSKGKIGKKMVNLDDRKWWKWHPESAFVLHLPICIKFMKLCRTDIKTLYALKQDARAYAGNLIYGVRLQMDVGDRLAETCF